MSYPIRLAMYFLPRLKDWRLFSMDRLVDEPENRRTVEKKIIFLCFCVMRRKTIFIPCREALEKRKASGMMPTYPNICIKRVSSFKLLKLIRITEWRVDQGEPVMVKLNSGVY